MLSANTIIPLTKYDALSDSVSVVYEIPVEIVATSLLNPQIGTSANSIATIIKSGLQYPLEVLETPASVNFLALANTATTTGLLLATEGASLDLAADGTDQAGAIAITKGITTVITDTDKTGVVLPVISKLKVFTIYNKGTLALNIYPAVDDYINGYAQDAPYVLAVGSKVTLYTKAISAPDSENYGWNIL